MVFSTFGVTVTASVFALVVSALLIVLILWLSHKYSWYDVRDSRKVHTEDVPRLGGVGLYFSFFICIIALLFIVPGFSFSSRLVFLLLGFMLVHLMGLVDDFHPIPALVKLLGQIAGGVLLVLGTIQIRGIALPFLPFGFGLGFLAAPLTVFWVISVSNAINLIDGLDGIAGGVSLICAIAVGIIHMMIGSDIGIVYSFTLAGAIAGFMLFNLPRARIFMGDSGSLFLGFALGGLLFIDVPAVETATGFSANETLPLNWYFFFASLTMLLLPVMDMLASILRRVRQKRPVHSPDREHLHHKLLDFGFSLPQILLIVYGIVLLSSGVAVLWLASRIWPATIPALAGDMAVFTVWVFITAFFLVIHFTNRRRKRLKAS
ncbi:MAG: undecaprenyl/decaprenyl-phosphate alpha-N-acetylglucosaminyl 1-phosphate transferase [Spirochaetaceae bacterium]|nr:MAG: undecaprenyl/decaprenyl-phosphate alpha-N-acetylglucosaminyl 1-phosphate transferase [Spirochaetaceae bacterium]